jgi:transcriptional regulator with PAS, ATPase and Fis domain
VCDNQAERLRLICDTIKECRATPLLVGELSMMQQLSASPQCELAMVPLGNEMLFGSESLKAVRSLKQNGFYVITYEDGSYDWPIGMRCLPLVAGACEVLDSFHSSFAHALRVLLRGMLGSVASAQAEDQTIEKVQRELGIVAESPAMRAIFRAVLRVSRLSDLPLLITGETGTGKELLARSVHQLDPKRCRGPFIAANCGAISPALAESEFFGHRRGAFTGAERDRKGLIRSAHGGILFLDEIGELDTALQPKLLRVLQEGRVLGVGEDEESTVDVRVLAATNRDLAAMTREGDFRQDLFHRLNVFSVDIPPLRERPSDLKPLVAHFLKKHSSLFPGVLPSVDDDFIEALGQLALPGNARQLENLIRQALVKPRLHPSLGLSDLPEEVWSELSSLSPMGLPGVRTAETTSPFTGMLEANGWSLSRCMDSCERILLETAMKRSGGNQSRTALMLGVTPRSIYNKLRKHRLS